MRLAEEHPAACAALAPVVEEQRQLVAQGLLARPTWMAAPRSEDYLWLRIRHERVLREHADFWLEQAQRDDAAGLRIKFEASAGVAAPVAELEQIAASR
jgi:hypothetical protein